MMKKQRMTLSEQCDCCYPQQQPPVAPEEQSTDRPVNAHDLGVIARPVYDTSGNSCRTVLLYTFHPLTVKVHSQGCVTYPSAYCHYFVGPRIIESVQVSAVTIN